MMKLPDMTGQGEVTAFARFDERLTLTVTEAGRLLGVGRGTAYAAVSAGEIPSIRLGRRVVVPRAALDRLLRTSTTVDAEAPGAE